jgi:ATP-dependent Lon protease
MQKFFSIEIPSYHSQKNKIVIEELIIHDEEIQEVLDSGECETENEAILLLINEYADECSQQFVNTVILDEEQLKILKEQIIKF